MSDGEWRCVRRGKGRTRREKRSPEESPPVPESESRKREAVRITQAISELRCEDFWEEWKEILAGRSAATADKADVMECVCYGLGNFSSCVSARYQLAMLLLLLDALQIPVGECRVYDPVFTESECETLRELGFTVLTENEEGKHAVLHHTLFYMMHCGKALYNNLLWKNWSLQILPKIIIVGNSFLGVQERMLQREFKRDYSFLSDVISVCDETSLPCSQRFLDVFNDTALIRFPPHKLQQLPKSTWQEPAEPQYEHCQELEIIQRNKEPK